MNRRNQGRVLLAGLTIWSLVLLVCLAWGAVQVAQALGVIQ